MGIGCNFDMGMFLGGSPTVLPFDPTTLSGCKIWLRADDAATVTQSGGRVSAWNDKSGNAHNFAQATGASQPLYVASAINGLPAIQLDSTARKLSSASFTAPQPQTLWLVMNQVSWVSNARFIDTVSAAGFVVDQHTSSPTLSTYMGSAFACSDSDLSVGAWGIVRVVANSNTSSIRVGSGTPSTGQAGTNGWGTDGSALVLGGTASSANIQIAEFVLFDHVQSAGDDTATLAGLRAKYGL